MSLLSLPCFAQEFIGVSRASVSATSRGSLGNAAGEVMTRVDGSEYAGWGTTSIAGSRTVTGVFCIIQDNLAQPIANTIDIKIYPESTSTPNTPDLTAGVTFATGVAGPVGTGTPAAIGALVTGNATVPIQGGGDVFVSFVLPTVTATSNLSIQIVLGYQPSATFTVFDVPNAQQGVGAPPTPAGNTTHFVTRVGTASTVAFNGRRQHVLDVAGPNAAGGAVGAITNQTSYTVSNTAPGTTDFMAGVNPDVVGNTAGRADDVSYDFFWNAGGTGMPVFFLADIGTFGPEVSLASYVPGSVGVTCLNASLTTLGLGFTTSGDAFNVITIPASVRPILAGFPLLQQGIGLDTTNNVLVGGPCGRQVF